MTICPIMSRPVAYPTQLEVFWVDCQEENCAWWHPGSEEGSITVLPHCMRVK